MCGPTLDLEILREVPNTAHTRLAPPDRASRRESSHVEWKRRAAPPPAEHMVYLGTQGKLLGVLLVSSLCGTAVPSGVHLRLPCPKRGLEGRGEGREDRFRGLSSRPVIPFFFC